MPFGYRTFYHSSSKLLVRYSRHGLNNGPFNKLTVLDHLNTKLVCYSDSHCITVDIRLSDMFGNQMVDTCPIAECHSVTGTILLPDEMSGNRMSTVYLYGYYLTSLVQLPDISSGNRRVGTK